MNTFKKSEKRIDELKLEAFMYRAILFKMGKDPDEEIDSVTEEDLDRYRAYSLDMEEEYL